MLGRGRKDSGPSSSILPIGKEFYDSLFPHVREAYDNHPRDCKSLEWLWLGHTGGFSCFNEQRECDECDVTFYNEGLSYTEPGPDDKYSIMHYCECCERRNQNEEK